MKNSEKKYFNQAQERFQLFFTTAGNVSKGAAGAVRRKLGYTAFDAWDTYFYVFDNDALHKMIHSKLVSNVHLNHKLASIISFMLTNIIYLYFKKLRHNKNQTVKLYSKTNAPLEHIETLWDRNKKDYGVSVDRSMKYLNWRINQNPFYNYQFLTYSPYDKLYGYIIFTKCGDGQLTITDISFELGYANVAHFSRAFKRISGLSPKMYRNLVAVK